MAFQLGLTYFALNQYDRAQPLLDEVFTKEPTLDSLGYYGPDGRREDRPPHRLYTGLSLTAVGLSAQAVTEVEQALRLLPASPLTGLAERLRDSLAASARRDRRFRAEVRVGVYFDDNATTRRNHMGAGAFWHRAPL